MLTKFSSWILFISSYIPLFLILAINNLIEFYENINEGRSNEIQFIIIVGMCILMIVSYLLLKIIFHTGKGNGDNIEIKKISKSNESILEYLFAYMVPFVLINTSDLKEIITFILLFVFVGIICVENELIYINPTLYLMGYNIYTFNNGDILISRKNRTEIIRKCRLNCVNLCNKVYLDVVEKEN